MLKHCRCLKEIPIGIGEAPLLKRVELHSCGDAANSSARQLQEEQLSLGNDLLKVYVTERYVEHHCSKFLDTHCFRSVFDE